MSKRAQKTPWSQVCQEGKLRNGESRQLPYVKFREKFPNSKFTLTEDQPHKAIEDRAEARPEGRK